MKKHFKCYLTDEGINVEINDFRLLISYDYPSVTWDKMKEQAEALGGKLPTWDQAMSVYEHKEEINEVLKEAGKPELSGWMWIDREHSTDNRFAWLVLVYNGYTYYSYKFDTNYVLAVSAFQL